VTKIPLNLSELCEMTKIPLLSFSFPFLFYSSSTITFFFLLSSLPPSPPTNNNFPQSTSIHDQFTTQNKTTQSHVPKPNQFTHEGSFIPSKSFHICNLMSQNQINFFLQFEQTYDLTVREFCG